MGTVIQNMPEREYHRSPGISYHDMKDFRVAPAFYQHRKQRFTTVEDDEDEEEEQAKCLRVGRAVHASLLLPDLTNYVIQAPEINKRTKAGRAEWKQFCDEHKGCCILTPKEMESVTGSVSSLRSDPTAKKVLKAITDTEVSLFWEAEYSGVLCHCRCRLDAWNPTKGIIVELKTTRDASKNGFRREVEKFRYDVQADYYREGAIQCSGKQDFVVIHIAVEPHPPYLCAVYTLGNRLLEQGRAVWSETLPELQTAINTNSFPGYPGGITELEPRFSR
jgi:exodeoxyribonuclease VIII